MPAFKSFTYPPGGAGSVDFLSSAGAGAIVGSGVGVGVGVGTGAST